MVLKHLSTKEFISAVEPQYAVIGVGKENKFGHPADETIKILQDRNVKIYRTDFLGEIWIRANAISIQMNGFWIRVRKILYKNHNLGYNKKNGRL